MKPRRLAWAKYYPGDYLAEQRLLLCTYAARGLWADSTALMLVADEVGYLVLGDGPATAEQIARLRGGTPAEVSRLLSELERAGVFDRDDRGRIFCRRIVRDFQEREAVRRRVARYRNRQAGSNGARNAPVTADVTRLLPGETRDQSLESRVQKKKGAAAPGLEIPAPLDTPEFRKKWTEFHSHRKDLRKPLKPTGERELLKRLAGWGEADAIQALQASIGNGWTGVFNQNGKNANRGSTSEADHRRGF